MRQKIHTSDFMWLLAYPLYQIVGTIRHEASHAFAGILEGAQVTSFVFLPRFGGRAWVTWGLVAFDGPTSWLISAAPYFCDLIIFVLTFLFLYTCVFKHHWLWINIVAIGLFGPVLNSAWNYAKLFHPSGAHGDALRLVSVLTAPFVHTYFLLTITAYLLGTTLIIRGAPLPILTRSRKRGQADIETTAKRHI